MTEESNSRRKSYWSRAWHEPVPFFLWLALVCGGGLLLGSILRQNTTPMQYEPGWFQYWMIGGAVSLGLGLVLGVLGFILALIPPVRRWLERLLQRRFFVLACMITFVALIYAEEDLRGWLAWSHFKGAMEAKGEKFDWASLIPAMPPDDRNFAMSPVWMAAIKQQFPKEPARAKAWYGDRIDSEESARMAAYLPVSIWRTNDNNPSVRMGQWRQGKMTDLKAWQDYYRNPGEKYSKTEFPVSPQPQSPSADVLLALGKYEPLITQLRQDAAKPESQFPINYRTEPAFDILLPHLAWLKGATAVMELRAVAELAAGNSDAALEDEKLIWRLTDAVRTEPFLISHLVRIAQIQIALQPVWEGLAAHRWSEAQLAELDQGLGKFDFLADYGYALRGERTLAVTSMDYVRRTGTWPNFESSRETVYVSFFLLPRAFFYQNELTIVRMHEQWILPLVDLENRTVSPKLVNENNREATKELVHFSPYNIFARMLLPAISNSVKRFTQAQSSVDLARVAVALERYRLAHGEFPATLDVLAPQFMDKVPHDVINGEPLHYRQEGGQFVLYSVGWNETDDGGVVVFKKGSTPDADTDKGDWVWKYSDK